jgi:hypothetical protein
MYDRDLRNIRRSICVLLVLTLSVAIVNALRHDWINFAGSGFWALCCCLWRKIITAQQRTRDIGRVIEAAVRDDIEKYGIL